MIKTETPPEMPLKEAMAKVIDRNNPFEQLYQADKMLKETLLKLFKESSYYQNNDLLQSCPANTFESRQIEALTDQLEQLQQDLEKLKAEYNKRVEERNYSINCIESHENEYWSLEAKYKQLQEDLEAKDKKIDEISYTLKVTNHQWQNELNNVKLLQNLVEKRDKEIDFINTDRNRICEETGKKIKELEFDLNNSNFNGNSLQDLVFAKDKEILDLKDRINVLETLIKSYKIDEDVLKENYNSLNKAFNEGSEKYYQLQDENKKLKEQIASFKDCIESQAKEYRVIEQVSIELDDDYKQLQEKLKNLESVTEGYGRQAQEAIFEADNLKEDIKELQEENKKLKEEIEKRFERSCNNLTESVELLINYYDQLENELETLKDKNDEFIQEQNRLFDENEELQDENKKLNTQIDNLNQAYKEADKRSSRFQDEVKKLTYKNHILETSKTADECTVKNIQKTLVDAFGQNYPESSIDATITNLVNNYKRADKIIQIALDDVDKWKTEFLNAKEDRAALEKAAEKHEKDFISLQTDLNTMETENRRLNDCMNIKDGVIQELEKQLKQLKQYKTGYPEREEFINSLLTVLGFDGYTLDNMEPNELDLSFFFKPKYMLSLPNKLLGGKAVDFSTWKDELRIETWINSNDWVCFTANMVDQIDIARFIIANLLMLNNFYSDLYNSENQKDLQLNNSENQEKIKTTCQQFPPTKNKIVMSNPYRSEPLDINEMYAVRDDSPELYTPHPIFEESEPDDDADNYGSGPALYPNPIY